MNISVEQTHKNNIVDPSCGNKNLKKNEERKNGKKKYFTAPPGAKKLKIKSFRKILL